MERELFRLCDLEKIENNLPQEAFEYLPCQQKFRLRPEDEISIDSIISALLSYCEPTEKGFKKCQWEVSAKDYLNEKQALLFQDKLTVSRLVNSKCQLSEKNKIFLARDLDHVGKFCLKIDESYDGYVVFARCEMQKGRNHALCGYTLKGKYDNKFTIICEKRVEYDYLDAAKVAKILDARNNDDTELIVIRDTRINEDSQQYRAVIKIKDRDELLILDGGVMLLMRYLVVNNFKGEYEYYTINLAGKILRCKLTFIEDRKKLRVLSRLYTNIILVMTTQYFNDEVIEVSETYFTTYGRIILHFWHGYNYILHAARPFQPRMEQSFPKMELMWRSDEILRKKYDQERKMNYKNALKFLDNHPEVSDFLYDYIISVLKHKPIGVLEFTIKFFQNMRDKY